MNMKRIVIMLCAGTIFLLLAACGVESNTNVEQSVEQNTEQNDEVLVKDNNMYLGKYDASRSEHDAGTCRTLAEDAAIVVFCADDEIKSWDEAGVLDVQKRAEWIAQYLRECAAGYGIELTLPVYVYASDEEKEIRFTGGTMEHGGEDCDALSSIASNLGFADKWEMHKKMQEDLQMDQIAYIVTYSRDIYDEYKQGFAQGVGHRDGDDLDWCLPEYSVISFGENFLSDTHITMIMMHEMLHTFGAQDFYRKEWNYIDSPVYNETRENLTKTLCPNEIMLGNGFEISEFTAYTIGWLDEIPQEYNCKEWWVGSQWEGVYIPD